MNRFVEDRKSKLLDGVIDYQFNRLDQQQVAALFQELHDTGLAYDLHVMNNVLGRAAKEMIKQGLIEDRKVTSLRRAEQTPFTNGASA